MNKISLAMTVLVIVAATTIGFLTTQSAAALFDTINSATQSGTQTGSAFGGGASGSSGGGTGGTSGSVSISQSICQQAAQSGAFGSSLNKLKLC
jgi:hypothetical protein